MKANAFYRGSALQNTLRRAFHPGTPEMERKTALAMIATIDPELKFIDTLDPNYSKLPEYHPTSVWRERLAAKDAIIAARDATIKALQKGGSSKEVARLQQRVATLTAENKALERLVKIRGAKSPPTNAPENAADANTRDTVKDWLNGTFDDDDEVPLNGASRPRSKPKGNGVAKNWIKDEDDGRLNPQGDWSEADHQFFIDLLDDDPNMSYRELARRCTLYFEENDIRGDDGALRRAPENTAKGVMNRLVYEKKLLPPYPRKNWIRGQVRQR